MSEWRDIATCEHDAELWIDRVEVDLWLQVHASPRSFGMSDSFRVVDAYRVEGKWYHRQDGKEHELFADYITHWMPIPAPPHRGG